MKKALVLCAGLAMIGAWPARADAQGSAVLVTDSVTARLRTVAKRKAPSGSPATGKGARTIVQLDALPRLPQPVADSGQASILKNMPPVPARPAPAAKKGRG